ncbi:MAG TPA: hypothetical protein VF941_19330 [Clostridia bacterium]
MIIKDYYIEYEGEDEFYFILERRSGEKHILKMMTWSFDNIMRLIEPENGKWVGMAYYYHVDDDGWYMGDKPWKIPDIKSFIKQLDKVDLSELDDLDKEVFKSIYSLLIDAEMNEESVYILRD